MHSIHISAPTSAIFNACAMHWYYGARRSFSLTSHLLLHLPKKKQKLLICNSFSATIIAGTVFAVTATTAATRFFLLYFKIDSFFRLVYLEWYNKFTIGVILVLPRLCYFHIHTTVAHHPRVDEKKTKIPATRDKNGQIQMYTISIQYFMSACAYLSLFEKVLFFLCLYHLPPVFLLSISTGNCFFFFLLGRCCYESFFFSVWIWP